MPGGPVSRQPFGSLPPSRVNCLGERRYLTMSRSSCFASSTPLTSENFFVWPLTGCTSIPPKPSPLGSDFSSSR